MFAFDPGQNGGDMAVLAIEAEATLLVMPGEAGEAAFDRRNEEGSERRLRRGSAISNIKGAVTVTGWCQLRVASSFLL